MITKEHITKKQFLGLLEAFVYYHKVINKVQPETLGWIKRKAFNMHKSQINALYEELK